MVIDLMMIDPFFEDPMVTTLQKKNNTEAVKKRVMSTDV
jgi:hypothetical protein